ncbi:uncharacterized protein BXZ73DRAFT_48983 [Epithele typhae]|uniref:uncharacterized protein n=1 Tax=Epithele typhae TaxID=378194 RepID=UPI0020085E51|nr:uncharacterized protein BXZ73DRAFT_48983 [Epithele typhae]KAH9927100.1 hypothetical protein BXZ73DRAFT_48983 [Epithele typhae]
MILDTLDLPYEILEASDRIGGRIFTYRFNGEAGHDAPINTPARYDYIDIGAMRYPNIPFMKRVFDLFERRLGMSEDDLLIEYKYSADNTFERYNDILYNTSDPAIEDIFQVSKIHGGAVPWDWVVQGVDNVANNVFREYAEKFQTEDFTTAWAYLSQQDPYSTRGYLLSRQYPESVVEWLETFETATGLYNNAFVESAMDSMDFGSSSASQNGRPRGEQLSYEWYCIDGGSDRFIDRMVERIKSKPQAGRRVTKIARTESGEMDVTCGAFAPTTYSQVICTIPLGCLDAIDIPRDDLSYMQRMAIRSLNYDTSTKVALKFATRWWEDPVVMGANRTIEGGISSTDLPIRTCVYPSYGRSVPDTSTLPGVLLASYTWAQDAQRLGGLAQTKGSEADARLVDITLQNLSALHNVPVESMGPLVDHFAFNWHNDPNARGAFALFGPGQFGVSSGGTDGTAQGQSMFASLKAPAAKGRLHVAGEATSVHHAWVLGALNSAWRAVYNALGQLEESQVEVKRQQLIAEWGIPDEEDVTALVKLALLSYSGAL